MRCRSQGDDGRVQVRFEVEDTGSGIPVEDRQALIAHPATTPALISADVPGRTFGDDRMIFTLVMPVRELPPARYVLRARSHRASG